MIHGNPFLCRFCIEIAVAERCLLELLPQSLRTPRSGVVQHRLINQAAALARLRKAVKGADRSLREDDIDSFCHSGSIS
jgi:hypothetical protein